MYFKLYLKLLIGIAAVFFMAVCIPLDAMADVSIEETHDSAGFAGMGASKGSRTVFIQGIKQKEESQMEFTGAILGKLAGFQKTITITRVDKGVYWELDPSKQTYTERTIALPKEKPEPKDKGAKKAEKPKVRVTKNEFSVKKTGASKDINNFPCEEYIATWLLETENIETKEKSKSRMLNTLWTTPETASIKQAKKERDAFNQALIKKMGITLSSEESKRMGLAIMAGMIGANEAEMKEEMVKFARELSKIQGYPIVSRVQWFVEGDKSQARQQQQEESEKTPDVSGGIGGFLSGLAGKAVEKKAQERTEAQAGKPAFDITIEIKSIKTDSVAPLSFEIPEGYTKR